VVARSSRARPTIQIKQPSVWRFYCLCCRGGGWNEPSTISSRITISPFSYEWGSFVTDAH